MVGGAGPCARCRRLERAIRRAVSAWPGCDERGPRGLADFWRAMALLCKALAQPRRTP